MANTAFPKNADNERKIQFDISDDPFCSEMHMERLTGIIDGIENGSRPLVEHDLIEAEDK